MDTKTVYVIGAVHIAARNKTDNFEDKAKNRIQIKIKKLNFILLPSVYKGIHG